MIQDCLTEYKMRKVLAESSAHERLAVNFYSIPLHHGLTNRKATKL